MKCSKVCVCIHFCFCVTKSPTKKVRHNRKINKYVVYGERGGKVTGICDFVSCFCFLNNGGQQEREINEI